MHTVDPTCLLTAALREKESQRASRLYTDPYASLLSDATGRCFLAEIEALTPEPADRPCTVNFNAIRTRLFDECLLRAVHENGVRQVVLVAAGLDTRAFRLSWPTDLSWFELDRPAVLEVKQQRLGALCSSAARRTLATDLTGEWTSALVCAGYRSDVPSVWLVEGLLYYWREAQVERFLSQVSALAAPGSVLALDLVNRAGVDPTHPLTAPMASIYERWGVRWTYGADNPEQLLQRHGFSARVLEPGDAEASFGRWAPQMPPRSVPGVPRAFYVFGKRMRQSE